MAKQNTGAKRNTGIARPGIAALAAAMWLGVTGAALAADSQSDAGGGDATQDQSTEQAPVAPSPAVAALDRFIAKSSPVCMTEPSRRCVDIGWRFADTDHDGTLSLDEVHAVRVTIQDWMQWKGKALSPRDRTSVSLGLIVVDMIGLDKLFNGFNASGTGQLTKAELLTDVRLDDRPLGKVLQDPNAVDRADLSRRLGMAAPIVNGMIDKPVPAAGRPEKTQ